MGGMWDFILPNAGSSPATTLGLGGSLHVHEILDLRPQYFGTAPLHPDRNLCWNCGGDGREVRVAAGDAGLGARQERAVRPRDGARRHVIDVDRGPLVGDVDVDNHIGPWIPKKQGRGLGQDIRVRIDAAE